MTVNFVTPNKHVHAQKKQFQVNQHLTCWCSVLACNLVYCPVYWARTFLKIRTPLLIKTSSMVPAKYMCINLHLKRWNPFNNQDNLCYPKGVHNREVPLHCLSNLFVITEDAFDFKKIPAASGHFGPLSRKTLVITSEAMLPTTLCHT